jgi:hypothetical protein
VLSPRVPRGHRGLLGLRRNTYCRRSRGCSPLQRDGDCVVDAFKPHELKLLPGAGEDVVVVAAVTGGQHDARQARGRGGDDLLLSGSCCRRIPIWRCSRTACCAAATDDGALSVIGASMPGKRTVFRTGTIGTASCGSEIGRRAPLWSADVVSKSGKAPLQADLLRRRPMQPWLEKRVIA